MSAPRAPRDDDGRTDRAGGPPVELDDRVAAALLPARDARSHKGTHGTLLVVAGSLDYAGAAQLVALAAGRVGAGLVCLAVPRSLQPMFAGRTLEAITLGLPETADGEVDDEAALGVLMGREHGALVVGPGLRAGGGTARLVRRLLSPTPLPGSSVGSPASSPRADASSPKPAVLDAEALNSLASVPAWWQGVERACVLTPHPGEFVRLRGLDRDAAKALAADDERRLESAGEAAREWGQVVVLKGARTIVAGPDGRVAAAPFENPALATAGTGDVLAGAIGSLLAQGLPPYDAACLGVYLHGAAGEEVRSRLGDAGLLAGDLPRELAVVRKRLAGVRERAGSGARFGFALRDRTG